VGLLIIIGGLLALLGDLRVALSAATADAVADELIITVTQVDATMRAMAH
jgi:hypothetical protein